MTRTFVLLAGAVVAALALAAASAPESAAAPGDAPTCLTTLTLPQSALELKLECRQLDPDLAKFLEPLGMDAQGLRQLQVMCLNAQGARLSTGVALRAGDHLFQPGRTPYPLGFTVAQGGALRFFLVDGMDAIPVPSEELTPGWRTERLVMHFEYASRSEVRLVWHLGEKAGVLKLGLGSSASPAPAGTPGVKPAAPPETPPAQEPPKDGAPRDGF